jgi:hypothetical protein
MYVPKMRRVRIPLSFLRDVAESNDQPFPALRDFVSAELGRAVDFSELRIGLPDFSAWREATKTWVRNSGVEVVDVTELTLQGVAAPVIIRAGLERGVVGVVEKEVA